MCFRSLPRYFSGPVLLLIDISNIYRVEIEIIDWRHYSDDDWSVIKRRSSKCFWVSKSKSNVQKHGSPCWCLSRLTRFYNGTRLLRKIALSNLRVVLALTTSLLICSRSAIYISICKTVNNVLLCGRWIFYFVPKIQKKNPSILL